MILRLTAQRSQADLSGLHPPPPSLLPRALLEHRSTRRRRRRRTQTVRRAPRAAPRPTPAPTDCVVASGVTADRRLDTAEIAARVEIVGPRENTCQARYKYATIFRTPVLIPTSIG